MNGVVYYSNTGQSKSVAAYLADRLGYPLADMERDCRDCYENLVLVFPVHCQNIPDLVKDFLKKVTVLNLTVIAAYGKMWGGNVLHEIQQNYRKNIVAAAYIPTRHAYLDRDEPFRDFDRLMPIIEKVQNPSPISLPKVFKNPLADIAPKLRSRLGLRITKTEDCCGCNLCGEHCSFGAIKRGTTNGKCIRCLRCVKLCPRQALKVSLGLPLRLYLRKKKTNRIIIYV